MISITPYPAAYSTLQCFLEDFGQLHQTSNNLLKEIFADAPNFQTQAWLPQQGLGSLLAIRAGAVS